MQPPKAGSLQPGKLVRGLAAADLAYFRLHADKPAKVVAQACHGRSLARTIDPLVS